MDTATGEHDRGDPDRGDSDRGDPDPAPPAPVRWPESGKPGWTTALGALGAVLTLISIVSYVGFVAIQSTHKARSCTAREAQIATELSAVSAPPIAGATLTSATGGCDTESPSAYANFDGPIAQSALVAAYRSRAAELGWQERAHDAATLLNFEAAAPDGTAMLIRVWTYSPIKNGVVSEFTVDAAADELPQSAPASAASPGGATSNH